MEQKIQLNKTFRYYRHGNKETAENLWIVLHGYGQLASFFIKKFEGLDPTKNFIIAPEGMHRFYLKGTSGRVGASWMTKEARMDDISDNLHFLDQLFIKETASTSFKNKILLGFSQGGATAARWHAKGKMNASHFMLWASVFPPDLSFDLETASFNDSKNIFLVGNNDPYYKKEKLSEEQQLLSKLNFETQVFEGEHSISSTVIDNVYRTFI